MSVSGGGGSVVVITSHLAASPAQHNLQRDNNFPRGDRPFSNPQPISSSSPTEFPRTERPRVFTAAPMRFQSASGRIRMPATLQYGFEPMTTVVPTPSLRPTLGPQLFEKPLGRKPGAQNSPKLFRKPLGQPRHRIRPRRVNVISFYEKETVLETLSDLFQRFLV